MESTINFGQSAVMFGEITVKNNAIEQNNFDMYRVVRMNEAPKVLDIHWVKAAEGQPPGGLGEPGTAVVQPAIANAIFAATGKRVRRLPLTPENIGAA
jgi:isoquinoline 1-oxidoreductase beta subunit